MKLAIVRQKYNPYGGAEQFIERALDALAATRKVELSVIARQWQTRPGVHFIECNPAYRTSLGRDKAFAAAVASCLAAPGRNFDIVQSHERIPGIMLYRAGDGVHASWLEQRARALPAFRRVAIAANPYHRYVLAAEREMFAHRGLRAVICNSVMVRNDIAARFGLDAARLKVIYNSVDLERFHPRHRALRASTRSLLGLPPHAPVFLYAGSGFERKGVARLLHAVAQAGAAAHVLVAGTDKHHGRYRTLAARLGIAARTHFLGSRDDLSLLYGAADAFVLPTLYDPMPNAALEALASGLPLVTTLQCGAQELVTAGSNGFVVDALDGAGMAAALASLAQPGRAAAMAGAARASVAHLSQDAMAAQLLDLYGTLAPAG